jgi:L-fucose mutarotase
MLVGVAACIGPELIAVLHRMGHGDEIVLADAFFPGESTNARVIRADGVHMTDLLDGVLRLINLDTYADAFFMMAPVVGDTADPNVEASYRSVAERHWPTPPTTLLDRYAFYDRARSAFAVVMTGETVKYGNLILKKGVVPVEPL